MTNKLRNVQMLINQLCTQVTSEGFTALLFHVCKKKNAYTILVHLTMIAK